MMPKLVEEDWSFFNQAVRDRAGRRLRPGPDAVTPFPGRPGVSAAAPSPPSAPPAGPAPQPPRTPPRTTIPTVAWPRLLSQAGRVLKAILRFLFAVVAFIMLFSLIIGVGRSVDWSGLARAPAMAGRIANGAVGGGTPAASGGASKVVTDFTTFNTVQYGDWRVVTGWRYARSADTVPTRQYCYMEKDTEGGRLSYNIENRGAGGSVTLPKPDALIPGLTDAVWKEAATKCHWSG